MPSDLTDKTIIVCVIDPSDPEIRTVGTVASRVRRAYDRIPAEQLVIATDCGMNYVPRATAEGKMAATSGAADILCAER